VIKRIRIGAVTLKLAGEAVFSDGYFEEIDAPRAANLYYLYRSIERSPLRTAQSAAKHAGRLVAPPMPASPSRSAEGLLTRSRCDIEEEAALQARLSDPSRSSPDG